MLRVEGRRAMLSYALGSERVILLLEFKGKGPKSELVTLRRSKCGEENRLDFQDGPCQIWMLYTTELRIWASRAPGFAGRQVSLANY